MVHAKPFKEGLAIFYKRDVDKFYNVLLMIFIENKTPQTD